MELISKTVTKNQLVLDEEDLKVLIVIGNSPVLAETIFNSTVKGVLQSYGLTESKLYSFLHKIPTVASCESLGMTFDPIESNVEAS